MVMDIQAGTEPAMDTSLPSEFRDYALARGYEIVKTYADDGKSGLRLQGRDSLNQLIQDVVAAIRGAAVAPSSFAAAGLEARHEPEGLIGRGLYLGRPA